MGIYLTDNPTVATDYTVKGGWKHDGTGTVLTDPRDEFRTQQEAVSAYIKTIIAELDWPERNDALKDKARRDYHQQYGDVVHSMSLEDRQKTNWDFQTAFRKTAEREFAKYLARAKIIFKERLPELKIYRDTTGHWVVMKNHQGTVTTFEIPETYLRKTLHGDKPLDEKGLAFVRAFIKSKVGDRISDFRDLDGNFMSFDDWIKEFRDKGSRYAWRDEHIGGKRINPSLDEVLNGTHGGTSIMYSSMTTFIEMAQQHGYTGIEYDGGVRIGALVRGGGGINHQAFVLWDDDYVNSCRAEQSTPEYGAPEAKMGGIRAPQLIKTWIDPRKR